MNIYGPLLYLAAFIAAVFIYGLRPLQRWSIRKFPGPKKHWLLGNAPNVMGLQQIFSYKKWGDTFGPKPYAIILASETVVVLPNADDARSALVHAPARPNMARTSIMPKKVGHDPSESLLWARGEQWRSLRAAWQPVFFSGSLKAYMAIMDGAAKLLVAEMAQNSQSKDKYFDMQPMIQEMTMNVIGQSAFGIELHTQKADKAEQSASEKNRSQRLLRAAREALDPIGGSKLALASRLFPFMTPLLRRIVQVYPDKQVGAFVRSRETLRNIVDELLEEHQDALVANGVPNDQQLHENGSPNGTPGAGQHSHSLQNGHGYANGTGDETGGKKIADGTSQSVPEIRKGVKPGSFIDLLVRGSMRSTGEKFTANQKAQQVMLMLMAGYETTANTLTFVTYLLSRACNAEIQAKVMDEIDAFGKNYTPSYEEMEEKMPYLDAVVKEALRLYPPGHILLREAENDLKIGGADINKGQMLAISAYSLHHDARLWGESVEEFRPERWLSGSPLQLKQNKQNFFAFGDGARVCPGQRFALLEIKITLIRILQQFTLHLGPQQEPLALRATITLGARDGVFVEAQPRSVAAA